ncbi:MAG: acyltransferase [Pseudomonadota bacterium]
MQFNAIQALRFFAALLVVIMHGGLYASERLNAHYASAIWDPGSTGVDIFFVISGFVICVASRKLIGSASGWLEFAQKRAVRIVPLYWILTTSKLALVALLPWAALHTSNDLVHVVMSYLFLPAKGPEGTIFPYLGVGWTLNFEVLFYALFCLSLYLKKSTLTLCLIVLPALALMSMVKTSAWPAWSFYCDPIVLEFLFGLMLANAILNNKTLAARFAWPLALLGLWFIVAPPDLLLGLPRIVNRGLPAFMLVSGIVFLEPAIGKYVPRWAVFLGDSSYALYLSHPFVAPIPLILMKRAGVDNFALGVVLSVLAAVVAAALLWKLVDRPLYQYLSGKLSKDRLRPKVLAS